MEIKLLQKKKRYFNNSKVLDYSDFVNNYKPYILKPDIPTVTHVAPINSSRLSVCVGSSDMCERDNRKKGIFVSYLTNIKELRT